MTYYAILKAARNQDETALKSALSTTLIDISKPGKCEYTAVAHLAWENNTESVAFLLKHGANKNHAAYGAALGGHHQQVKHLIKQGANINWIAQGAAQGGSHKYTEFLRKKEGASINHIAAAAALAGYVNYAEFLRKEEGASSNWIAAGAARGGDTEYAEFLRKKEDADINWIALGAAQGDHVNYAEFLLNKGANIDTTAQGAAECGNQKYAESLRKNQNANINYIALGAAAGGHRDEAESWRKKDADIDWIAQGAAHGGHCDYADFLRENNADIDIIAKTAAEAGHHVYAESLRKQGANIDDIALFAAMGEHRQYAEFLHKEGADIKWIAYGLIHGEGKQVDSEKSAFQFLVHIKNETFRDELIRALARHDDLSGDIKQQLPSIQKRITHVYQFKNKYDLKLSQAIAIQQQRMSPSFLLLLLMPTLLQDKLNEQDNSIRRPALDLSTATIIMRFIYPLRAAELQHINFQLVRFYLQRSITQYCTPPSVEALSLNSSVPPHNETAQNFQLSIQTQNPEAFFTSCREVVKHTKNQDDDTKGDDPFIQSVFRAIKRNAT